MGLNYTATAQTERTTRYRASRGECLIAELEGKIVGTIALHRKDTEIDSTWHRRDDVAILEQFAVEPAIQGSFG